MTALVIPCLRSLFLNASATWNDDETHLAIAPLELANILNPCAQGQRDAADAARGEDGGGGGAGGEAQEQGGGEKNRGARGHGAREEGCR